MTPSSTPSSGLPTGLWPLDDRWLQALPQPVLALDPEGRVVGLNAAAATMLGMPAYAVRGRTFREVALDEANRGGFDGVLGRVLSGTSWAGELEIRRADAAGLSDVHVVPVSGGGEGPLANPPPGIRTDTGQAAARVTGAILVAEGVSGRRDRAVHLSERLTRLARVVAELLHAADLETVTDIVVHRMADAAGATSASLSLLVDDSTLRLVRLRGGPEGAGALRSTYSLDDPTPAGEAARSGRPVIVTGAEQMESRYPGVAAGWDGERSVVCLALTVGSQRLGVACMAFPGLRTIDAAELELYRIMAYTCAQAIERIRAVDDAADQAAKKEFLAQASVQLASSLDYEATLSRVAWLAVPRFADWCAIAMEQQGALRNIAVAHADPAKLAAAEEYQRRYQSDPGAPSSVLNAVHRTGRSRLFPEITGEMLSTLTGDDPVRLRMLQGLDFHSALVVPLTARGHTFGVIAWASGETGRRFGFSDVRFGEDLAGRAAMAIDNALLHSELREVTDRLQRAVLPGSLPLAHGWELGSLYETGGRTDMGGDFYDAIPLDGGRLALFVGDVMGRGVTAASAMSQVCAALRAIVAVDPDPTSVMTRLDLLFARFPTDHLVTLVYAVADPARDELAVASAGHPPPLLVAPGGEAHFVESARGLILGAGGAERAHVSVPFRMGQTLVMYTDGLVERRGEDLNIGKQRLLAASGELAGRDLETSLSRVASIVRDPGHDDDLAMLAARRVTLLVERSPEALAGEVTSWS